MKALKAYEQHLGHPWVINMDDVYFVKCLDEEWVMREDNSGEDKHCQHYCYSAVRVLELIDQGYAELMFIKKDDDSTAYHIKMKRTY